MMVQGRVAASQAYVYRGFPIDSLLGTVGRTKEMRPLTQPAMVVNESNALINRSMC